MPDYLDVAEIPLNGRITLKKRVMEKMNIKEGDYIGFFEDPTDPLAIIIRKVEVVKSRK
jgi:hypothetical protein